MVSDPNFKFVFTNLCMETVWIGFIKTENTISTCFVFKTCVEFIPLTVRFNFSLSNSSFQQVERKFVSDCKPNHKEQEY